MKNTYGIRSDFKTGQFVPQVNGKDVSPTSFDQTRALEIAGQIAWDMNAMRASSESDEQSLDEVRLVIEQCKDICEEAMGESTDGLELPEMVRMLHSQRENARNAHAAVQEERDELVAALGRITEGSAGVLYPGMPGYDLYLIAEKALAKAKGDQR